ncbi:Hint domain-containing protein [Methylobacterium sp. 174MFSha1.1]|uniref:Hint domain-containing protein n=1 Tax=Methylobacterium sp. 174MFSha1.1 TaxID=1502749 RepID=UPI0008E3C865|nr:Hint domain-containing protein [Methylobacterium sp. 174MFSha1.1]SFV14977.1 Hint domain-containing protein [Methylobacterium sp. 174MFSha1.1]
MPVFNNTVYGAGFVATDDGAPSAGFGLDDVSTASITVTGTVAKAGDTVQATGIFPTESTSTTKTLYATQYDSPSMIQFTDNPAKPTTRYVFSNTALAARQRVTFDSNNTPTDYAPVCFVTGSRLRTLRGEVAVEDLRVGDRAVTASGALRPVIWIGHRDLDGAGTALPRQQQPIRIRAGAFGPGLPARDLLLSPGHPVLVGADADGEGGHLVPIMCLINGTSIVREPVAAVTYWHVELDAHDVLLAEGLPAESYLDWGDRPFFAEGSDHALHNPDFVVPGLAARCRPVAVEGPVVEAERARLSGVFAASLGEACAWDEAERFAWIAA